MQKNENSYFQTKSLSKSSKKMNKDLVDIEGYGKLTKLPRKGNGRQRVSCHGLTENGVVQGIAIKHKKLGSIEMRPLTRLQETSQNKSDISLGTMHQPAENSVSKHQSKANAMERSLSNWQKDEDLFPTLTIPETQQISQRQHTQIKTRNLHTDPPLLTQNNTSQSALLPDSRQSQHRSSKDLRVGVTASPSQTSDKKKHQIVLYQPNLKQQLDVPTLPLSLQPELNLDHPSHPSKQTSPPPALPHSALNLSKSLKSTFASHFPPSEVPPNQPNPVKDHDVSGLSNYLSKKQKLAPFRSQHKQKIASLGQEVFTRCNMVESLLGNAREGKHILGQFSQMMQVPSEEFSLNKIKQLKYYLKTKVSKPDPVYQGQARWNPKHLLKLTTLEDLVQPLPPPIVRECLLTQQEETNSTQMKTNFSDQMLSIQNGEEKKELMPPNDIQLDSKNTLQAAITATQDSGSQKRVQVSNLPSSRPNLDQFTVRGKGIEISTPGQSSFLDQATLDAKLQPVLKSAKLKPQVANSVQMRGSLHSTIEMAKKSDRNLLDPDQEESEQEVEVKVGGKMVEITKPVQHSEQTAITPFVTDHNYSTQPKSQFMETQTSRPFYSNQDVEQKYKSNGFYTIEEQAAQNYTLKMTAKNLQELKANKYHKSSLGHLVGDRQDIISNIKTKIAIDDARAADEKKLQYFYSSGIMKRGWKTVEASNQRNRKSHSSFKDSLNKVNRVDLNEKVSGANLKPLPLQDRDTSQDSQMTKEDISELTGIGSKSNQLISKIVKRNQELKQIQKMNQYSPVQTQEGELEHSHSAIAKILMWRKSVKQKSYKENQNLKQIININNSQVYSDRKESLNLFTTRKTNSITDSTILDSNTRIQLSQVRNCEQIKKEFQKMERQKEVNRRYFVAPSRKETSQSSINLQSTERYSSGRLVDSNLQNEYFYYQDVLPNKIKKQFKYFGSIPTVLRGKSLAEVSKRKQESFMIQSLNQSEQKKSKVVYQSNAVDEYFNGLPDSRQTVQQASTLHAQEFRNTDSDCIYEKDSLKSIPQFQEEVAEFGFQSRTPQQQINKSYVASSLKREKQSEVHTSQNSLNIPKNSQFNNQESQITKETPSPISTKENGGEFYYPQKYKQEVHIPYQKSFVSVNTQLHSQAPSTLKEVLPKQPVLQSPIAPNPVSFKSFTSQHHKMLKNLQNFKKFVAPSRDQPLSRKNNSLEVKNTQTLSTKSDKQARSRSRKQVENQRKKHVFQVGGQGLVGQDVIKLGSNEISTQGMIIDGVQTMEGSTARHDSVESN